MMYKLNRIFLLVFIVGIFVPFSCAQQPTKGTLLVQSTPGRAQVYVDDTLLGTTSTQGRLRLPLMPGAHTLRLSHQGYGDWNGSVKVTIGHPSEADCVLPPAGSGDAVPTANSSTDRQPTMLETAQWIASNLARTGGNYNERSVLGSFDIHDFNITAAVENCILNYSVDETLGSNKTTYKLSIPLGSVAKIDNSKLPYEVHVSAPYVFVSTNTQSITKVMTSLGVEPNPITSHISSWKFVFAQRNEDNLDLANRMVRALAHARDLCKASYNPHPGEPF